jgi:pSer/pThr/pTyr-binding forkhead associated (FHA) protein
MNPFLQACGAEGPLQLDIKDCRRSMSIRWTFEKPYALIGRDPRSDVVLDHEEVSLRHAYVQVIEGRPFFVDLGSRTGIVRENRQHQAGWLGPDQRIEIGPFVIQVDDCANRVSVGLEGNDELDPLSGRASRTDPRPGVILQFQGRSAWRIRRLLTLVGTAPRCKLRLIGSGVSSYHCSLVRTSAGMWVVDLKSRTGIFVNRTPVEAACLGEGDVLEVGGYQFHFHAETAKEATTSRGVGLPAVRVPDRPAPETGLMLPGHKPFLHGGLASPTNWGEVIPQFLVDQLASMQQQMLGVVQQQMSDQLRQVVEVMAHLFDTLHRDQSGMIRQELESLRRLNQNLEALQTELVTRSPAAMPPASGDASVADALARIEALLSASATTPCTTAAPSRNGPNDSAPVGQESEQATSSLASGAGEHGAAGSGAMMMESPSSAGSNGGPPPPQRAEPAAARPGSPTDEEIHALLHRRIATLRKEQQGRLQRIVELMLGR